MVSHSTPPHKIPTLQGPFFAPRWDFFTILNTDLFKWSFSSRITWHKLHNFRCFVFFYINLAYKVRTKTVEMYHKSIPFIGIQLIFSTGKEKKGNYSHRNGDSAHHSTQYYTLQGEHGIGNWYLLSFWSVSVPECIISPVLKITNSTPFQQGAKTSCVAHPER